MTDSAFDQVTETARTYYNSNDADTFYFHVWGGEDIHVGLYESDDEPIRDASQRTVERLAAKLGALTGTDHVVDQGAGFGGAARYLADRYGCRVSAVNLSETQNARNREMNIEQGLSGHIDVYDASFENVPLTDGVCTAAWSQDAILHSGNRKQVLQETWRLLQPGSRFVFTDPMQSDDCPDGVLQPILDRIHLDSLASPAYYEATAREIGFEFLEFEDHTPQLTQHYSRVLQETIAHETSLRDLISADYLENMKLGLQHWIDGGNNGYLAWGIFTLRKPE